MANADPLAAPVPLLGVPLPDHARVDAEARVVDEDAAVQIADVDVAHAAVDDRLDRLRELQRNAGVLGEVIQRAQWKHAERRVRLDRDARDGPDGSVPARRDEHVSAARGLPRARSEIAAVPDALEPDGCARGGEERLDLLAGIRAAGSSPSAR